MDPLRVSQINLQHSRDATGELVSVLTGKTGQIVLIQEPYVFRNQVKGLGGANYNLVVGTKEERPRTAILTSKDLNMVPLPQLGTRDVTAAVLEYKVSGSRRKVIVGSAYFPYDNARLPPTQDFERVISFARDKGLPVIIGCDANSHHIVWGSTDSNIRGVSLLEYLASTNLEVLNKGREPTFVNRIRQEVIDITLVSQSYTEEVLNWRVSSDISMSDHRMIRFDLRSDRAEEELRRNPRATNWERYASNIAHLQEVPTEAITSREQLEMEVANLGNQIVSAYEEACPPKMVGSRRVPWWNKKLAELRKTARTTLNKAVGEGGETTWDDFRDARRVFKKELRRSKRASWRAYCGELNSLTESARLMKILSCESRETVGSIRREDGTWTTTSEESLKLLLETHFPGDGSTATATAQVAPEMDRHLAEKVVTDGAITWAVNEFSPYKAAGPDGIFPALLQRGLDILLPWMRRVFRASLALGYVPQAWRSAKVVFIPKAGKKDYTNAKSFRPISLTSFLMKTQERIIDRYLVEEVLISYPIQKNQHAYQRGKSTETALHSIVHKVERALHYKEVALVVLFDVEGAFDKARTATICTALETRGTTPMMVSWVRSALEERRVSATLGDCQLDTGVRGGCPQGSCLSPRLWCLVMDGLMEQLTAEDFYVQAYADDGLVLVTGRFLSVVCERMQLACRIIERWCGDTGLSVNPTKTEMILFTRRKNTDDFRAPIMYNKPLALSREVKYLGVTLDSKLSWRAHIDKVVEKAVATFWQLRRVVGRRWGLSPRILHWVYTAVLRPRVTYGSVVWWPAVTRNVNSLRLSKIQRLACLGITGAMRTTPTAALNVILGLPPLHDYIKREAMASHLRIRDAGNWQSRGMSIGHAEIAKVVEREIPISTLRTENAEDRLRLNRSYNLTFPTKEQWERSEVKFAANSLVCYTDGSRMASTGLTGAGIYLENLGVRESYALGAHSTVFQAEVYAILAVADREEVKLGTEQVVYICSDSQAALKAVSSPRTRSALVQECGDALERLAASKDVRLVWVPGHCSVPGNEVADKLAKLGAGEAAVGPEPVLGMSKLQVSTALNKWADDTLAVYWRRSSGCRQTRDFMVEPDKSKSVWLLGQSRGTLNLLIGVLTGHCRLRRHLSLIGVEDNAECPRCGQDEETSFHFLGECEAFGRLRYSVFGTEKLRREEACSLRWSNILTFIRRSRRFEEEAQD